MGLNDMNGRIEDAVTGRLLSADPTVPDAGNTQSYNRYTYVNNNPLTFSDRSGFTPCNGRLDDTCSAGLQQAVRQTAQEKVLDNKEFFAWLNSLEVEDWDAGSPIGIEGDGTLDGTPAQRAIASGYAAGAVPLSATIGAIALDYASSTGWSGPSSATESLDEVSTHGSLLDGSRSDVVVTAHGDGRPGQVT
jgi:hypothetical protein